MGNPILFLNGPENREAYKTTHLTRNISINQPPSITINNIYSAIYFEVPEQNHLG